MCGALADRSKLGMMLDVFRCLRIMYLDHTGTSVSPTAALAISTTRFPYTGQKICERPAISLESMPRN